MTKLIHPKTGLEIRVPDERAPEWRAAGWLDPTDTTDPDGTPAAGDQITTTEKEAD